MSNITKQDILEAIRRTTKENGGKPLGVDRFEKETGINPYDWGKYWARFGDAQKEAGFSPNQLQGAYDNNFLFEKIIGLARKIGRFPTYREIEVERSSDAELPNKGVFYRFGAKEGFVSKIMEYCRGKSGYEDIVELCESVLEKPNKKENDNGNNISMGEVYLLKSGRYYKVGKTNDTVRRGNEIRIQLPEKMNLIHSIRTDDPSGVEAYWHRRFEAKRMQGEWFDLNSADIKAFKRWKRII
jgi:hypothetical protein